MREQSYKILNNSQSKDIRGGETKVMKKLLSSLIVLALLFTMVVPAFAATPSDVKGTDSEAAVAKLVALGVLNGYPDGTFKPDNTITRAEFAKIVAYAAGFGKAAEYLGAQNTSFTDVKADNGYGWASGYIAVATNKGYLKGYPDGSFKPANNVTYAEVVTVLLRVLGYNDNLIGNWPTNYIIQADELGLLGDVNFAANVAATRGAVAILTSSSLDQKLVKFDKDTDSFEDVTPAKTLLAKAFEGSLKDAVVVEPKLTGKNENIITLYVDGAEKTYEVATDYVVVGAPSVASVWGNEVQVLFNKDGKVSVVVNNQADDKVVTGVVEADVTTDAYEVDLKGMDAIDFAARYFIFNNEEGVADQTIVAGAEAKLFLNKDGEVRFATFTTYAPKNALVTDLSALSSKKVATISYEGTALVDSEDATAGYVENIVKVNEDTVYYVNGEEATYADLAEDQVINVVRSTENANYAAYVYAYDNVLEGKVTAQKGTKVKVDGVYYTVVKEGLSVVLGDEYTFALNKNDEIVADITTGTSTTFTGILVDVDLYQTIENGRTTGTVADALIVDSKGVEKTVRLKATTFVENLEDLKGELVSFTLNSDGKLESTGFVAVGSGYTVSEDVYVTEITAATKRITFETAGGVETTERYASDVVVFNVTDFDGDFEDVKVGGMELVSKNDQVTVFYKNDVLAVKYIVITNDGTAGSDQLDPVFGLFVEGFKEIDANDDVRYYVTLDVNGENFTYEVESNVYASMVADQPYALVDLTQNGTYDNFVDTKEVTVTSVSATAKTFVTADDDYIVTTDTVIYYQDGDNFYFGTFADITAGATVQVVENVDEDGNPLTVGAFNEAAIVIVLE